LAQVFDKLMALEVAAVPVASGSASTAQRCQGWSQPRASLWIRGGAAFKKAADCKPERDGGKRRK